MTTTPPAYRAYLLRLWRTAEGQWRASLEGAHSGERLGFATLGQLAEFLRRETEAGLPGNTPRPAPSSKESDQA